MAFKTIFGAAFAACLALPALGDEARIEIMDPYARSGAQSGAAFFTIMNHGAEEDRLIGAASDVARRVELHTHLEDGSGVMRMREVEGGITVPAGGTHALARGGDHVMFMGLDAPLPEGETVTVTLIFEKAGEVTLEIPVDNDRKPQGMHGHGSGHGSN